jgi:hypothetical protein
MTLMAEMPLRSPHPWSQLWSHSPPSLTVRSHSATDLLSVADRATHQADVHPTTC